MTDLVIKSRNPKVEVNLAPRSGFEPEISGVTGQRPLQAGPPGHGYHAPRRPQYLKVYMSGESSWSSLWLFVFVVFHGPYWPPCGRGSRHDNLDKGVGGFLLHYVCDPHRYGPFLLELESPSMFPSCNFRKLVFSFEVDMHDESRPFSYLITVACGLGAYRLQCSRRNIYFRGQGGWRQRMDTSWYFLFLLYFWLF